MERLLDLLLFPPAALLVGVVGPLHLRLFSSGELRPGTVGGGEAASQRGYLQWRRGGCFNPAG